MLRADPAEFGTAVEALLIASVTLRDSDGLLVMGRPIWGGMELVHRLVTNALAELAGEPVEVPPFVVDRLDIFADPLGVTEKLCGKTP